MMIGIVRLCHRLTAMSINVENLFRRSTIDTKKTGLLLGWGCSAERDSNAVVECVALEALVNTDTALLISRGDASKNASHFETD